MAGLTALPANECPPIFPGLISSPGRRLPVNACAPRERPISQAL
jgi:hypothetical protein